MNGNLFLFIQYEGNILLLTETKSISCSVAYQPRKKFMESLFFTTQKREVWNINHEKVKNYLPLQREISP